MATVKNDRTQHPVPPTPTGPSDPAEWTRLLFARANPRAELDAVEALATSALRTLDLSRAFANAGRMIDLAGLESSIGRLTAGILDLDPADGRKMRPALIGLRDSLDRLEHAVVSQGPPPAISGPSSPGA
jgi:hypothetical protein